ncbi:hypothetical protein AAFF_G00194810 [Aldrovandia affinis]|uniref:Uncharacterized protein n=1 Tax=Aldrovandia affinis TaxID=143900 RepID=A0AAD7WVC6_9TELE|nr:hypothetical protein AAFF_G00194810 [Aldrovandia affinis]
MYPLDGGYADSMERGTPQRKTVYRISLTLVKKESLQELGSGGNNAAHRRVENPKVGAFRHEATPEIQRSCLLGELKEVEDETDEFAPRNYMRNFRTFSTGQLELGRLKISRKTHHFHKDLSFELKDTCTANFDGCGSEEDQGSGLSVNTVTSVNVEPQNKRNVQGSVGRQENRDVERLKRDICSTGMQETHKTTASRFGNTGTKEKRDDTASGSTKDYSAVCTGETLAQSEGQDKQGSSETPKGSDPHPPAASCPLSTPKGSGKAGKALPQTPPLKRHPSLLRRSFSFRHWTGGELLRIRALSKEKHHSSSSCIGQSGEARAQTAAAVVLQNPAFDESRHPDGKRNTLDVAEVLNKTDPLRELSRRERAKGKNRTLDNSDLHKISEKTPEEQERLLRGGPRSGIQEGRLLRFFSGIFSRKDATSTPVANPNCSLRQGSKRGFLGSQKRGALGCSQSSTESMNRSPLEAGPLSLLLQREPEGFGQELPRSAVGRACRSALLSALPLTPSAIPPFNSCWLTMSSAGVALGDCGLLRQPCRTNCSRMHECGRLAVMYSERPDALQRKAWRQMEDTRHTYAHVDGVPNRGLSPISPFLSQLGAPARTPTHARTRVTACVHTL